MLLGLHQYDRFFNTELAPNRLQSRVVLPSSLTFAYKRLRSHCLLFCIVFKVESFWDEFSRRQRCLTYAYHSLSGLDFGLKFMHYEHLRLKTPFLIFLRIGIFRKICILQCHSLVSVEAFLSPQHCDNQIKRSTLFWHFHYTEEEMVARRCARW